ncbi:selenide, water dikinase SelD, partial [candidate division WOR-3 bacterium]|nr:selenide, water dikinase SelD [candidate division WOR-3 bacterium]
FEGAEDAGIYKLTDNLAIVQTLDFFTPIVDDPYIFGQITVANALSDVYAMGGKPLVAMNIVAFPIKKLDVSVLQEILKGGLKKMDEAEVILVGGHSVEDSELKYGISVTGVIHPDKVITNAGAEVGDQIVLTKPIGTGIINTALKENMVKADTIKKVTESMTTLNRKASEIMQEIGVSACTDVTGFGLLGHACEMIVEDEKVGMVIYPDKIPLFPETENLAKMGIVPAGAYRNKMFRAGFIEKQREIPDWMMDILFDPQTSGGLLICVSPKKADEIVQKIKESGIENAIVIGEIVQKPRGKIILQ